MSKLTYTPVDDIPAIVGKLRRTFNNGKTRDIEYRREQLRALGFLVQDNEQRFLDAFKQDLGRTHAESSIVEYFPMIQHVKEALDHFDKWVKVRPVKTSFMHKASAPAVKREAKGVVLISAPWNYPAELCISPLTGAISGGNTAVIKPSEQTPTVAALLAELVPKYLDQDSYVVVNGAVPETSKLLEQQFDHIFFTGSTGVGKIYAQAAAKHLTTTTLELGGKSPVVVYDDANLKIAARRIIWGKTANCGQTCIAPDYVICSRNIQDKLIKEMAGIIKTFSKGATDQTINPDYSSIVNSSHFNRLKSLVEQTEGEVAIKGGFLEKGNKIGTTVVKVGKRLDDKLMESEIFGPVLPIVTAESNQEIVDIINKVCDTPLALYVFAGKEKDSDYVFSRTRSGTYCRNDVIMFFAIDNLPFGGVGQSGMGNYHGEATFNAFTYERAVVNTPFYLDALLDARYPPYTKTKSTMMSTLMKKRIPKKPNPFLTFALGKTFGGKAVRFFFLVMATFWAISARGH